MTLFELDVFVSDGTGTVAGVIPDILSGADYHVIGDPGMAKSMDSRVH
jgi:hypothetical protein